MFVGIYACAFALKRRILTMKISKTLALAALVLFSLSCTKENNQKKVAVLLPDANIIGRWADDKANLEAVMGKYGFNTTFYIAPETAAGAVQQVEQLKVAIQTYNRLYMDQVMSAWIARNRSFVGVMLDIDRFKMINDKFGHSEGDKALKRVTDILKRSRSDNEWVFRFAGDEFIVLKLAESADGLSAYLDEVNRRVKAYNSGANQYPLSLSYGVSFFDKGDVDSFMRDMDERMYEMKARHHNRES